MAIENNGWGWVVFLVCEELCLIKSRGKHSFLRNESWSQKWRPFADSFSEQWDSMEEKSVKSSVYKSGLVGGANLGCTCHFSCLLPWLYFLPFIFFFEEHLIFSSFFLFLPSCSMAFQAPYIALPSYFTCPGELGFSEVYDVIHWDLVKPSV